MSNKTSNTGMLIVLILFPSMLICHSSCCEKKVQVSTLVDTAIDLMSKVKLESTSCHKEDDSAVGKPLDCDDLYRRGYNKSGVYTIYPINRLNSVKGVNVNCEMVAGVGGWTIIQRRGDYGRANDFFFQDWNAYKKGFGNLETDFWLGNDNIFAITNQKSYSIYFDLEDRQQNKAFAQYDTFWIDDEFNKYTLHISGYRGTAGDSMAMHNNVKFTTKDQDNDQWIEGNCALLNKSGWWFTKCYRANLNGEYNYPREGIRWIEWKDEQLSRAEIKIRPIAL